MKNLLIIFLIFTNFYSFSVDSRSCDSIILTEVEGFINKVNSNYKMNGSSNNKYIVYVLYLYKDSATKNICFTLTYVLNSNDPIYILPTHYFSINGEYILVKFGKGIAPNIYFQDIQLTPFNTYTEETVKIIQKLYPSSIGGFTYQAPGLNFCFSSNGGNSIYYENADEIPIEKSIWSNLPEGAKIEQIR